MHYAIKLAYDNRILAILVPLAPVMTRNVYPENSQYIYLYIETEMAQVVVILLHGRQGPAYLT